MERVHLDFDTPSPQSLWAPVDPLGTKTVFIFADKYVPFLEVFCPWFLFQQRGKGLTPRYKPQHYYKKKTDHPHYITPVFFLSQERCSMKREGYRKIPVISLGLYNFVRVGLYPRGGGGGGGGDGLYAK